MSRIVVVLLLAGLGCAARREGVPEGWTPVPRPSEPAPGAGVPGPAPGAGEVPGPTGPTGEATAPEAATSAEDARILPRVREIDAYEIVLGELAQERGSPDVKTYASTLVQDHQRIDEELQFAAESASVALEPAPPLPVEMQATVDRLRGLQGAEFDRAFRDEMVTGHLSAIRELEGAQLAASQPVADFLGRTVATMQRHLDAARELDVGA